MITETSNVNEKQIKTSEELFMEKVKYQYLSKECVNMEIAQADRVTGEKKFRIKQQNERLLTRP